MKIVFMGTPEFAVPSLQKLLHAYSVEAVISQPDKPNLRGKKMVYGAVKRTALENGALVLQPETLKSGVVIEKISELKPDLIVVAAYGKILPKNILEIPKHGCINVHASLLPKYRGAAPIQWSLINGESQTGVTIMQMNEGLDTGDILSQRSVDIEDSDTYGSLCEKLSVLGAEALMETIDNIQNMNGVPQEDSLATVAPIIGKELARLNWKDSGRKITGLIRGLNPAPGAYCELLQKKIKLWRAEIYDKSDASLVCGEIIEVLPKKGIVVNALDECVIITELQMSGKNKMAASEFIKGNKIEKGMIFL